MRNRYHEDCGTVSGWIGTSELLLLSAATLCLLCGAMAVGQQDTRNELSISTTDRDSLEQEYLSLQERHSRLEADLKKQQLELETQQQETERLATALANEQQLTTRQAADLQQQTARLELEQQRLEEAREQLTLSQAALLAVKQQLQTEQNTAKQASTELARVQNQLTAARRDTETLQQKLTASEQALRESRTLLAAKTTADQQLREENAALKKKLEEWGRATNSLVALRGPLRKVVFIYDTSGSMSEGDRFESSRQLLKQWISNLQMEQFAVIDFDSEANRWRTTFEQATEANRAAANEFLEKAVAGGNTRTDLALETAFSSFPDVDTIVLLTDGRMTGSGGTTVPESQLVQLRSRLKEQHAGVVINTIGIGNYFSAEPDDKTNTTNQSFGHFLMMIAVEHNGVFIGLGEKK